MKINDNIKRARMALHMTQDDLADAIGASRVTISKYENGHFLPSVPALEKLASVLGTTPAALTDSDPTPPLSDEVAELVAIAKRAKPAHVLAAAIHTRSVIEVQALFEPRKKTPQLQRLRGLFMFPGREQKVSFLIVFDDTW